MSGLVSLNWFSINLGHKLVCGCRSTAARDGLFDSHVKWPTYFDLYLKKNSLVSYYRNDYFIKKIIKIFKREKFSCFRGCKKGNGAKPHFVRDWCWTKNEIIWECRSHSTTAPQHLETRIGCARNIHFVFPLNFISRTLV